MGELSGLLLVLIWFDKKIFKIVGYFNIFNFLYCPAENITLVPFHFLKCELPNVFVQQSMYIPLLSHYIGLVNTSEWTMHLVVISLFASLLAPFAGFFASGLKRGLKIKVYLEGFLEHFPRAWRIS